MCGDNGSYVFPDIFLAIERAMLFLFLFYVEWIKIFYLLANNLAL